MAIDTYADLKQAVADYAHNDALADQIPNFIRSAELSINRTLKTAPMEVETPLFGVVGSRFIPLPGDFGTPVALWDASVNPRVELELLRPEALPVDDGQQGASAYWSIDGMRVAFDKPAEAVRKYTLRYVRTLFLSDAAPTNDLFAKAPDLYLYGALSMAAPYCRDNELASTWRNEYMRILREVSAEASRTKAAALRTDQLSTMLSTFSTTRRY